MSGIPPNHDGPVYVGLGANVGDPERTFVAAAEELSRLSDVELRRRSSLYATAAIGPTQPDFRNAVVSLVTRRSPEELLAALLEIERAHGRVRAERWGPRVLDLDILLWGDRVVDQPGLHVPHRELHRRRFALEPLAELDPEARHPVLQKTVAELLAAVRDQPVERLDSVLWRPR
ncbi:MAG TPA: 2-amino-4-hydroxy-6-hydroxymethyldihydropteridine diphosphokinase [Myxococcaceae bacterium]|nr:2-amino-4-hydroxy-6-hydroxymethyldihydropteridine diphosphokinase [Myxococcaceae bacterium]